MLINTPTIKRAATTILVLAFATQLVNNGNALRFESSALAGELESNRDVSLTAFTPDDSGPRRARATDALPARKISADEHRFALKPAPTRPNEFGKREIMNPHVNRLFDLSQPRTNRFRRKSTYRGVRSELRASKQSEVSSQNETPQQFKDESSDGARFNTPVAKKPVANKAEPTRVAAKATLRKNAELGDDTIFAQEQTPCLSPSKCNLSKTSESFSESNGAGLLRDLTDGSPAKGPQATTFGDGSQRLHVGDSTLDDFYNTYTTGTTGATNEQHFGENHLAETQPGAVNETGNVASQQPPVESCLSGSCFDNSFPANGGGVAVAMPPCNYVYAFSDSMYVYRSGGESGDSSGNGQFAEDFDDFELAERFTLGWENGASGLGIDGRFWRVNEWGRTQRGEGNLTVVGVDIGNGNSTARYESDLKSVELNLTKYLSNWTQIGIGPRWMNLEEHAFALGNGAIVPNLHRRVATRNELFGGQIFLRHCLFDHGGDLQIDWRTNVGLFHNEIDRTLTNFGTARLDDSTTSLMLETEIAGRFYLSKNSYVRFGYQFNWISDLALSIDQFFDENEIRNDSDLYLHGLFLGGGWEW